MDEKKFIASVLTLLGIVAFSFTFYRAVYYAPTDEIPLSDDVVIADEREASVHPIRLTVPKIDVDAPVVEVGISKKGNMSAPNSYSKVGWYKYGALPGEFGSAVLAGHLDNGLALPGVFSKLGNLDAGDDIYVTNSDGKKLHFKVTKKDVYAYDADVDEVFKENDARLLRLITCTGTWIAEHRTHDQRLVVTATLMGE